MPESKFTWPRLKEHLRKFFWIYLIGIVVCVPALMAAAPSLGYVTAYGVLVAILCNMGIATPGGSGFVAIAQKDGYIEGGETMKFSLLLIALMYIAVMLLFWPLARAIFA